jgi:hypothetical protein
MLPDGFAVSLLGALVGTGELIARYRDAPARALWSLPAALYLGINAAASVAALAAAHAFGWTFGVEDAASGAGRLTRILVSGFGAMAVFRSSLFNMRVGDQDVGIGPAGFLQVVLQAADRAVDRRRASPRALTASRIMEGVSFKKAVLALPTFCFALMQNVPADEQSNFGAQVRELDESDMPDHVNVLSLGLALMNVVGDSVLRAAVDALGDEIREESPAGS